MQQNTCNFFFLSSALNFVDSWSTDIFVINFWSVFAFVFSEWRFPAPVPTPPANKSFLFRNSATSVFSIYEFCQCFLCYECYRDKRMSWDSVVVIATRLRVGTGWTVGKIKNARDLCLLQSVRTVLWFTQAPDQCVPMALTPRVKQSGREAGYWLPFCYEINITSLPHTPFLSLPQ